MVNVLLSKYAYFNIHPRDYNSVLYSILAHDLIYLLARKSFIHSGGYNNANNLPRHQRLVRQPHRQHHLHPNQLRALPHPPRCRKRPLQSRPLHPGRPARLPLPLAFSLRPHRGAACLEQVQLRGTDNPGPEGDCPGFKHHSQ